jgi:predicted nucleic acid-binding protein
MSSGYQAVLDACVLVNAALRDTLLRLAEPPELYLPRWSADILAETTRSLEAKLGLTPVQTAHLTGELRTHFEDAWVEDYASLLPAMTNHPKDRHVLAAAVRTGAQVIVTFNRKDFPEAALAPWNVVAQSPDEFLVHQFHLAPEVVTRKLAEQAQRHGGAERLLSIHRQTVPEFASLVQPHLLLDRPQVSRGFVSIGSRRLP